MKKIRRIIAVIALSGAGVLGGSMAASAATAPGYANFPGNNGISCNAWHGAPGGYPAYPTAISNQQDPGFGHEQNSGGAGATSGTATSGTGTGYNNSTFAANCKS